MVGGGGGYSIIKFVVLLRSHRRSHPSCVKSLVVTSGQVNSATKMSCDGL